MFWQLIKAVFSIHDVNPGDLEFIGISIWTKLDQNRFNFVKWPKKDFAFCCRIHTPILVPKVNVHPGYVQLVISRVDIYLMTWNIGINNDFSACVDPNTKHN